MKEKDIIYEQVSLFDITEDSDVIVKENEVPKENQDIPVPVKYLDYIKARQMSNKVTGDIKEVTNS